MELVKGTKYLYYVIINANVNGTSVNSALHITKAEKLNSPLDVLRLARDIEASNQIEGATDVIITYYQEFKIGKTLPKGYKWAGESETKE